VIRAARDQVSAGRASSLHLEERFLHKDGRVLWGALTLSLIHHADERLNTIVEQIVDVTARKTAEEERGAALEFVSNALQRAISSEERFRIAAESTSDFIYEWDIQTGRLEWFGAVDECLGYKTGQFPRTFEGWKAKIHPDDLPSITASIEDAMKGAPLPSEIEYRIRTRTGAYRYWLGRGRALRDKSGEIYKWIGACTDITHRKEAEEQLRRSQTELLALTERLLTTEEEQQRSLARELHDDFNQRLAALSHDLAAIEAGWPSNVSSETKKRMDTAEARLADLSDDIRRLAHRLHPATLEIMGLQGALRELCLETSKHGQCSVRFVSRGLPKKFPRDLALCLYRVTQESIRNLTRHSRSGTATVTLSVAKRSIRLSIKDDGVGFDPAAVGEKGGLGLISMKERVRLAGGVLSIESRPGKGTQVVAKAPLPAGERGGASGRR
jgi:two-component system sensor histidine kinase UhpB